MPRLTRHFQIETHSSLTTPLPSTIVGYAATLMGDTTRANQYGTSVESRFVNVTPQFPYPWYDGEDGWFMRMIALQDKAGSS